MGESCELDHIGRCDRGSGHPALFLFSRPRPCISSCVTPRCDVPGVLHSGNLLNSPHSASGLCCQIFNSVWAVADYRSEAGQRNWGAMTPAVSPAQLEPACAKCGQPAKLQCPKCLELHLEKDMASFCSQQCFAVRCRMQAGEGAGSGACRLPDLDPHAAWAGRARPPPRSFHTHTMITPSVHHFAGGMGGAQEAASPGLGRLALCVSAGGGPLAGHARVQVDWRPQTGPCGPQPPGASPSCMGLVWKARKLLSPDSLVAPLLTRLLPPRPPK